MQVAHGRGEHEHIARRLVVAQQELHPLLLPTIPAQSVDKSPPFHCDFAASFSENEHLSLEAVCGQRSHSLAAAPCLEGHLTFELKPDGAAWPNDLGVLLPEGRRGAASVAASRNGAAYLDL